MRREVNLTTGEVVDAPLTEAEAARIALEDAEYQALHVNDALDAQILALEATQTPRRMRDAALTDAGKAWLADLEAQIAGLRGQRVKPEGA